MGNRGTWMLGVVLAACAVVLPFLALLQFRWLGELGDAERERMRRNVQQAAAQLAQEFDQEVNRTETALQAGNPETSDALEAYTRRFSSWRAGAAHPNLVKAFYAAANKDGRLRLWRMDPATGRFQPAEWPASLERLRARFTRPGEPGFRPGYPLDNSDPASPLLVAPWTGSRTGPPFGPGGPGGPGRGRGMRGPGPPFPGSPGGGAGRMRQPFSETPGRGAASGMPPEYAPRPPFDTWSIVELDLDYARSRFLPELVKKYLAVGPALDYRVQVVAQTAPPAVLFDSLGLDNLITSPDAQAPMFRLRPANVQRPGPGGGPPGEEFARGRLQPLPPLWAVLVQHRAGSLEAVVNATRRRNLALSAAILSVLAAAIGTLIYATRRSQNLAQAQSEFIAGVSHELRTPLSVIRLAGQNLADGVASTADQQRRYGEVIRDEGERLSEIVEQVIAYSKAGLGRARMQYQALTAAEIVEEAVERSRSEIESNGCRTAIEVAGDVPPLRGDRVMLVHCLRNLVINAARHGVPGGRIRVAAAARDGRAEFLVEDEGPGIAPEDMPHLFEPFYRGRSARDGQTRGLGLGLTLVYRIVRLHGGTVSASTTPGKGSCFRLVLPAALAAARQTAEPESEGV